MKPIIYISGKITGLPRKQVEANFLNAETQLHTKGVETVNPVRRIEPGTEWKEAMEICLHELTDVDGIFLMDNWTNSKGAIRELYHYIAYCDTMGKNPLILTYEDLKPKNLLICPKL